MSAPVVPRREVVRLAREAFVGARALLGQHDDLEAEPAAELGTLDAQLAVLAGLLRDVLEDTLADPASADDLVRTSRALHDVSVARFTVHDHLARERVSRLDSVDEGLSALRRVVDRDELVERVCATVMESCGFDRVMLSRVDDQVWRPWRSLARVRGEREYAFADWMSALPAIRLKNLLLEHDMVHRRRPAIVVDAREDDRVHGPLLDSSGVTSYVAAPIVAGERVIGLLHADRLDSEVDELDREVLWVFALGFAQIFERAVLLARLREQQAEVTQAMRAVEGVLEQLASAEIDLTAPARETPAPEPSRALAVERRDALQSLLTARELEVLSLMATGATNERIAQQLVIATGTVKTHVKQILRKLRVENRAAAISRYLRLTVGAGGT